MWDFSFPGGADSSCVSHHGTGLMLVLVSSNRKPGDVTVDGSCKVPVDGSCALNKQQSPHTGASHSILQNWHTNTAGECFEYFLGVITKRKKLLKQGRNCPFSVTSLQALLTGTLMDVLHRSHVEMNPLYSNPPHQPLLPTMSLRLGNRVLVWRHSPRQLNALGSWHVPWLGRLPALWCSSAHKAWLQSMWRREGVEEPLIWLPTSKAHCSGGYVTAVIEASVGGCNCGKGKLSGWAGLLKMKARVAFAEMKSLLGVR